MAAQKVEIESDSGSHERVALDLMKYIRTYSDDASKQKSSAEIITLYKKCLGATFRPSP